MPLNVVDASGLQRKSVVSVSTTTAVSLGICYFVKHSLFDIILFFIDIMVQFPSRLLRAFAVKLTQSETLQSKNEQSPCKVRQMSRFVTLGCHQPQDKTLLLHIGVLVVHCRDVEAW